MSIQLALNAHPVYFQCVSFLPSAQISPIYTDFLRFLWFYTWKWSHYGIDKLFSFHDMTIGLGRGWFIIPIKWSIGSQHLYAHVHFAANFNIKLWQKNNSWSRSDSDFIQNQIKQKFNFRLYFNELLSIALRLHT